MQQAITDTAEALDRDFILASGEIIVNETVLAIGKIYYFEFSNKPAWTWSARVRLVMFVIVPTFEY